MAVDSLARQFQLVQTKVALAGVDFDILHPKSADDLISEEDFAVDERLPYWANLWPSARVLARRIAIEQEGGRSFLELGAGLGLPSLVAAARGFDVLATDYYEAALEFVRVNAERNHIGGIRTQLVDYRRLPEELGRFDLVAASDVLYEKPYAALVAETFAQCLAEGGLGVLTDPNRQVAAPFADECRRRGLEAKQIDRTIELEGQTSVTVNLLEIRRAAPGAAP